MFVWLGAVRVCLVGWFCLCFFVRVFFFFNTDISMFLVLLIQDLQHGIRWIASLISTLSPEGIRCAGQKFNNLVREGGIGVLFLQMERREAVNPNLLTVIDKLDSHELYWVSSNVTYWFYINNLFSDYFFSIWLLTEGNTEKGHKQTYPYRSESYLN